MCGIAGFLGRRNNGNLETLQSMINAQVHRGPDAEGIFFEYLEDYQVALGHRRLSILDVSDLAGQPMTFEHLTITYNGEVYNFLEIKNELRKSGYKFTSTGDTEVVLKAFHCWGMQAIDRFRGMFAFCIFDQQTKKAYLVRDRVGVKPLYYSHTQHGLLFSSELKSLHCHPDFNKTLCDNGLQLYFQFGYISAPWTIYANTKKVMPGHYVEFDLVKNTVEEKKYWDLSSFYLKPKLLLDENEAVHHLEKLLIESFSLRLISDVPVGVLLSGGIDSSLVAAVLSANSSRPIETFTMGFHLDEFDESQYARQIAEHLGTTHHEQLCTAKDAESVISHFPMMYDEPFADDSAIPTALISKFARERVTVALSGDGGDELFCGYNSYILSDKRFDTIQKIPKNIAKILNLLPDPMMFFYRLGYDRYNRYLKLKSIMHLKETEDKYKFISQTFTQYDMNKLFLRYQNNTLNSRYYNQLNSMERMMLVDFKHYLPDDILVKIDRATMYTSLEGREPLLDHKILEFAAQLPIELKKQKYVLKNILAKYIPRSYFERKKHGFGVPINAWLKKELRHLVEYYLNPAKIKQQGILNADYITKLWHAFLKNKTNDTRIWTLLVFQMWHEKYL